MINDANITVVVQGAIAIVDTYKSLKSVRQHLPSSEIILSTWKGSDISSLDGLYDLVIFNDDPGAEFIKGKNIYNNLNRQLVSTQEGIKRATKQYILKLRSDLVLTGNNFLSYFNQFLTRDQEFVLFKNKVLVSSVYTSLTIDSAELGVDYPTPFHIADWWFFGLKEDIEKYFLETPIVKEPEFTNYYFLDDNKDKLSPYGKYGKLGWRFAPEQYFGYSCFSRNFQDIYMEHASDLNNALVEKALNLFIDNFIPLDYEQSGIYLPKYIFSKNGKYIGERYFGLCNFGKYELYYKNMRTYPHDIIPSNYVCKNRELYIAQLRLYKHFGKLNSNSAPISRKIEELFIGIPHAFSCFIYKLIMHMVGKK